MKIISIKVKSSKTNQIFWVELEGEADNRLQKYFVKNKFNKPNLFELHSEVIVKYGLATNLEVEQDTFLKYLEESEYLIALNVATTYLASRLKTTKQLKDYLYKKEYKTNTINKVVDKLKEYKVLNDDYYAEMYINSNENKMTKRAMQNKLASKGIKKEDYEECLQEVNDRDLVVQIAQKFMRTKSHTKENYEKLVRHLSYKGFNFDDIKFALNHFKFEENE